MSLLKPAANQTAYLKAGIMGFQGSGKTYTAAHVAAGLAKLTGKKQPKVAFFDTEKGSDFFVKYFKDEGVQFDVVKSRAFVDLLATIREVEEGGYDVLIIDSISHVWNELRTSYEQKLRRRNGLQFQDWAAVKAEWGQFTTAFINSKVHIIVLGRAGYEYDYETNEDTQRKELVKTGTKMKAEGEFGYESDVLLEMELVKTGKKAINRCYVIKDRTDTMNGKVIDNPKFEDFRSIVQYLNIGGEHVGVHAERNSREMFDSPDYSVSERRKQHDIALEELKNFFIKNDLAGKSVDDQKRRLELLEGAYGGKGAWAYIETLDSETIRDGILAMQAELVDLSKAAEEA